MEILKDILLDILYILIPVVVTYIATYVRKLKLVKELEMKKDLALVAVKFVEQAYRDYKGEEKLNKAIEWVFEQSKKYKLNITEDEIRGLIEYSLREVKDLFGEDWVNAKVK